MIEDFNEKEMFVYEMFLSGLFLKDTDDGFIWKYGDSQHDALYMDKSGIPCYLNLQTSEYCPLIDMGGTYLYKPVLFDDLTDAEIEQLYKRYHDHDLDESWEEMVEKLARKNAKTKVTINEP